MNIGSAFTRAHCQVSRDVTNEWIEERLNAGAFKEMERGNAVAMGFAPFDKPERCEHQGFEHSKGEYVTFCFVKHQKRVPAAVLRMHVTKEAEKYAKEYGHGPSHSAISEIRELMAARLTEQAFPVPTGFPVIWHTQSGRMLLGTTSAALIDEFIGHFEKVFQLYPQFQFHSRWALSLLSEQRMKERLKALFAWDNPFAVLEARQLGNDFLTWLWFFSEREPKDFSVNGRTDVLARVDSRLVLVLPSDRTDKVICVTSNEHLPEAREAIRQGKVVDGARLCIEFGENQYELSLESTLQCLRSVKLPKVMRDSSGDPNGISIENDGFFLERMFHVEAILQVLDALYLKFLDERLSPTWERGIRALIEQWFARTEEAA